MKLLQQLYCPVCGQLPQRALVAIHCAFSMFVVYGQRSCMVGAFYHDSDFTPFWTGFAVLHVGYLLAYIPAGILIDKYGPNWFFVGGMLLSTVLALISPAFFLYVPWYITLVVLAIFSIAQGVMYPAISVLLANWVPESERARLGGFTFGAEPLAMACGFLTENLMSDFYNCWYFYFIFWGVFGLLWCFCYFIFIWESPSDHPFVSDEETEQLTKDIPGKGHMRIHFSGILGDCAVWVIFLGQMYQDLSIFTMTLGMGTYMASNVGLLPQVYIFLPIIMIALWGSSFVSGLVIDHGIKSFDWNIKWTRRAPALMSFYSGGLILVTAGYIDTKVGAHLCLTLAAILTGPIYASFRINHLDLTRNYCGLLMGLIKTVAWLGTIPVILAIKFQLEWWSLFAVVAYFYGWVFIVPYACRAKAERAEWDFPDSDDEG